MGYVHALMRVCLSACLRIGMMCVCLFVTARVCMVVVCVAVCVYMSARRIHQRLCMCVYR